MRPARLFAAAALASLVATTVLAYPLDGWRRSGIRRLEGYRLAQEREDPGSLALPPGALLPTSAIVLRLASASPAWDPRQAPRDPDLQRALDAVFARRSRAYSVSLIDITRPDDIRWAGVREDQRYYPGSVGKVLLMIAFFDALARAHPEPADRQRVLRETVREATDWSRGDSHRVPFYEPGDASDGVRFAPISPGDRFSLSEWVDHMVSPSANAGASMVWKEAMLLRRFGADYPPSAEAEEAFFAATSKDELYRLSQRVIEEPLAAAGLDAGELKQGKMFTRTGKARIPGTSSFATAGELARMLLRLEQGRLIDEWSSLEMKRYLYFTRGRYRYVHAPELDAAAVFFKSGSFYTCREEEGYECGAYRGNVNNYMNSIAIIESPATGGPGARRYIVALMSNVLRKNSAWEHSRLGAEIEAVLQAVPLDRRPESAVEPDAGSRPGS